LWKAFAYAIIRTTIARLKFMRRTQIATTANAHSEIKKWRDNNVLGLITAWDHEIRFAPNRSSALLLHGYGAERPAAPTVNRRL